MRNIKKAEKEHNGMRVTVHYTKKWAYTAVALILFALPALIVYAFQSGQQPSVFGHSSNEIEFNVSFRLAQYEVELGSVCGMSSYQTISNSNGSTYCSIAGIDDDSTIAVASPACDVRRRTDGLWEYRMTPGCSLENCVVQCFKINAGQ